MALDGDVVGRIEEGGVDLGVFTDYPGQKLGIAAVSAADAVTGLRQLLADVDAGRVDTVVVYKIDRLTRALSDFARIVELLDKADASFVSVTQSFNTTTSMGRLTLNVLLSFAQFEREVTGERIRDKIALSKKKGMWMGGVPPLGYDIPTDPTTRALVIHPADAERVRSIFQLYLKLGTVSALEQYIAAGTLRF